MATLREPLRQATIATQAGAPANWGGREAGFGRGDGELTEINVVIARSPTRYMREVRMAENFERGTTPKSCNGGRPPLFKVGDWVRFAPDLPRPHGWVEMTWRVVRLLSHWSFDAGEVALANLEASDGTTMDAVDTRLLVPLPAPERR